MAERGAGHEGVMAGCRARQARWSCVLQGHVQWGGASEGGATGWGKGPHVVPWYRVTCGTDIGYVLERNHVGPGCTKGQIVMAQGLGAMVWGLWLRA